MPSPGKQSVDAVVARLANWLALVMFATGIRGLHDASSFARGWGAPTLAITLLYAVVARRRRYAPAPRVVVLFLCVSAVLVAQVIIREHALWQPGLGRWAMIMTPLVVLTLPAASARVQRFLSGAAPAVTKAASVAVAAAVVAVSLVVAGNTSRTAVDTLASAFSNAPRRPNGAEAVVKQPQDARPRRFPPEHSRCIERLIPSATPPDGIGEPMWSRILLAAATRPEWRLCRVAGVARGPDGTISMRVFSAAAGPEGYILARQNGKNTEIAFVEPQAGQLYFQQPGGTDMVEWGIPSEPAPCGDGGRLSVFRAPDGSITGLSRWSREITPDTRGTLTAYFTPASLALPLLAVVEASQRTLPVASGSVTGTGLKAVQYFDHGRTRIEASESSGTLTMERLIAAC
jgi:hypothetical protein